MTTLSAVIDTAPAAPAAPAAPPSGSAPGGASFEAALTQALTTGGQPQVQVPVQIASANVRAPELPIQIIPSTDSDPNALPADAIAAFLAVFLAMAGQMLNQSQPETQVEGEPDTASSVKVEATAPAPVQTNALDVLRQVLDDVQQVEDRSKASTP